MSDDAPNSPPDLGALLVSILANQSADLTERKAAELGVLSLKSADMGVCVAVMQAFKDPQKPDSPNRAAVVVLSGPIPDDILDMLKDYTQGLVQDYTAGNKDLKIFRHDQHQRDDQ